MKQPHLRGVLAAIGARLLPSQLERRKRTGGRLANEAGDGRREVEAHLQPMIVGDVVEPGPVEQAESELGEGGADGVREQVAQRAGRVAYVQRYVAVLGEGEELQLDPGPVRCAKAPRARGSRIRTERQVGLEDERLSSSVCLDVAVVPNLAPPPCLFVCASRQVSVLGLLKK